MKIYIASSWKNEKLVITLATHLRDQGYEVDCFADDSSGRYVFHWSEMLDSPDKLKSELNAISFLKDERTQKAFQEDKKWLDWCDCCILFLPAGNSSHLEAGYAKGKGKKLIIFHSSLFLNGEFDVMYGFADFMAERLSDLINYLASINHIPSS